MDGFNFLRLAVACVLLLYLILQQCFAQYLHERYQSNMTQIIQALLSTIYKMLSTAIFCHDAIHDVSGCEPFSFVPKTQEVAHRWLKLEATVL